MTHCYTEPSTQSQMYTPFKMIASLGFNVVNGFNPSKCEFLQLTKKTHPLNSSYHINNALIKQVTIAKYLGIDKNLNWSEHTKIVVNKANSALGFLHCSIRKCSQDIKWLCFKSLVCPILVYACVIWSPYHQHNIYNIEMAADLYFLSMIDVPVSQCWMILGGAQWNKGMKICVQ